MAKVTRTHRSEQQEIIAKMVTDATDLGRARKTIDRAMAIKDGLIPPPAAKTAASAQAKPERRGRGSKWTPEELAVLQQEYATYRPAHPEQKLEDVDAHLAKVSLNRFKKPAHSDTIRDLVRKPVDEAKRLEK